MPKPQPWYTFLNQPQWSSAHGRNRKPNPPTHSRAADRTRTRVDSGTDDAFAILPLFKASAPPTIPYAGVRAGEIIGHRMWWITDDGLCSLTHYRIWQPGETIFGAINVEVYRSSMPIYGGVYSFATIDQLRQEFYLNLNLYNYILPRETLFLNVWRPITLYGLAIGTIKCWGEVIEHERGWRAQFAKLHTIDSVTGFTNIDVLRERYLHNGQ